MRRDCKLIITNFFPYSRYYKHDNVKANKNEYAPTNTYFENITSYTDIDSFNGTTILSKLRNGNINEVGENNNLLSDQ